MHRPVRPTVIVVIVVVVAVLLGLTGRLPAQAQSPSGRYVDLVFDRVERTNDLTFGQAVDRPSGQTIDLKLDLYEPAGDTEAARPVFVFLFGGGFVAGNKELEPRAYCELMARRGYVAVAPSYRINQGDLVSQGIPAAISDARQAVNWLIAHAEDHRLDPSRIVIGGSSAGAITALFTAYTDRELQPADRSQRVALVMDLWGGLYTDVDAMEPGEPPLIIIHGTADTVVPFREAEKLRDRAEAVDIPYAFHPLQGKGHAPYMPAELMTLVAGFAYDRLWAEAPTPVVTPTPGATASPNASPSPTPTDLPTALPSATNSPAPPSPSAEPGSSPSAAPRHEIRLPYLARG
ncbi:MAG: alpha/beta hydrolase [Caldilineae bacterium]|nr:alpha/beta hydrolase [Chloroflexota bacterium]MCB9176760.1 alpha/beta hydrolase [Caldilineae bacterium]